VRVLVLNAGSANLKASLIDLPHRAPILDRTIGWADGRGPDAIPATVREILDTVADPIDAIGHRVVHGGERYLGPTRLDDGVIAGIEALTDLAPLHNPRAVATIRSTRAFLPDVPQVAAFDTAFHATLPEAVRRYPVPDDWVRAGIRRYGFHGLSVAWSVQRASEMLGRPVGQLGLVVAHLGGGCSVTAVDGGRSVDTSMGMTPLEGLMMGTRAGSIDPGIVFRRLRDGQSPETIESDLDRRSGLVGVAGTADMVTLLARDADGDEPARLAIEMFVRRAAAGIAASATNLATIDAIVFTGGIGQHAQSIRARICERLRLVRLDGEERELGEDAWLATTSGPAVLRIAAREDLVIAAQVGDCLRAAETSAADGLAEPVRGEWRKGAATE
jgi:acetate kinase